MKRVAVAALVSALALVSTSQLAAAASDAPPLTLDILYNSPSIFGTSPEGYAWSSDGKQLAFLWDDQATNVRDVWVYSVASGKKQRLSSNGKDVPPTAIDLGGGVSQVAWLPRGKGLVYVLGGKLYAVSEGQQPRQIETQRQGISRIAVAPNGRQLAFVADGGALWVRSSDLNAAAARQIVPAEPKLVVQSFQWNEASDRIVLVQADDRNLREIDIYYDTQGEARHDHLSRLFPGDETTRLRVGVVPVAQGEVKWLERTDLHDPIWSYGISANGSKVFVSSSDFLVKTHSIFMYDTASGSRETFYSFNDPKHNRWDWLVAWAPKDQGLVMLSDRDGHDQLFAIPTAGAAPKALTDQSYEIQNFKVDPAHNAIYFISNKSQYAERQIYRVAASGGTPQQITRTAGSHDPVYSPDFAYAADRFSNDTTPPDLYLVGLKGAGTSKQVTTSPLPAFSQYQWATVRYITFPAQADGATLMGRLVLPPGYDSSRRYPLVVGSVYTDAVRNAWGGRTSHPTWGLDQYLASKGYVQLNVSLAGSWGFGRAFKERLSSYGTPDIEDIQSGARYLVSQGIADEKRIGLWGSSYGGLLTLMSLYKKPGFYAVGVAGAPASNVWHAYPPQMRVMGEPKGADFPARYEQQSAYYHTQGLQDPLMIIHGTRDSTVLYADTVALQERMVMQGKTFEIVPVPGSDHKWDNNFNEQTRFVFGKLTEFLDRYLMK
ncbi:MAG TPA: prolyl oligopeptidase family serine peptidase [Steroidobacteraceae bacterium]|nr:prolyl oligopeptidase family serine peptidase [Steroidobacteraceae bacterium]